MIEENIGANRPALRRPLDEARSRTAAISFDGAELARAQSARDLEQALAREEFELSLQPQVDLSGATLGYRALLRWRRAERGPVPLDDSPMRAQDSELTARIDLWLLRQCCREAALWRSPLRVAANLSAALFFRADFIETLRALLRDHDLPPRRLELEIGGDALAEDPESASAILRKLKALGLTLTHDGFGAGASTLPFLPSLPFDRLKLDRSFVASLKRAGKSRAVIRALVDLGKTLGLEVVAQGVETRSQLALLREAGCTQFQGDLLGPPLPLDDYAPLARRPGAAASLDPVVIVNANPPRPGAFD